MYIFLKNKIFLINIFRIAYSVQQESGTTCCLKEEEMLFHDVDQKHFKATRVEITCFTYEDIATRKFFYDLRCHRNQTSRRSSCCCETCENKEDSSCTVCPTGGYNFTSSFIDVPTPTSDRKWLLVIPIILICAGVTGSLLYLMYVKMYRRSTQNVQPPVDAAQRLLPGENNSTSGGNDSNITVSTRVSTGDTGANTMDCATSGKGQPMLTELCISRTIRLGKEIGKGRFGVVCIGAWQGRDVAVKIFDSRDDARYACRTI